MSLLRSFIGAIVVRMKTVGSTLGTSRECCRRRNAKPPVTAAVVAKDAIPKQEGVRTSKAIQGKVDQYGSRFTVDLVTGPIGGGTPRTGWILRPGYTTPMLTTLFVE